MRDQRPNLEKRAGGVCDIVLEIEDLEIQEGTPMVKSTVGGGGREGNVDQGWEATSGGDREDEERDYGPLADKPAYEKDQIKEVRDLRPCALKVGYTMMGWQSEAGNKN